MGFLTVFVDDFCLYDAEYLLCVYVSAFDALASVFVYSVHDTFEVGDCLHGVAVVDGVSAGV